MKTIRAMICTGLVAGIGVAFSGLLSIAAAQTDAEAMLVVADKVRSEGFTCDKPSAIEADREASKPDLPVWIITCEGARYRVELVPDMRARVTQIQ